MCVRVCAFERVWLYDWHRGRIFISLISYTMHTMFSFPCIIVWICFVCCIRAPPPHTLVCVCALEWVSECRFGNMNQLDVSCCICSYTNKFLVYSGMLDKRKTLDKYVFREREREKERAYYKRRPTTAYSEYGWMDGCKH